MLDYKVHEIEELNLNKNTDMFVLNNNDIDLDFKIKRLFFVKSKTLQLRGNHAHKKCIQTLICLNGKIDVTIDNSKEKKNVILDSPLKCLTIYPGVWSSQLYDPNSSLMVLCSEIFDENDYIRDYKEFIQFHV